MGVPPDDFLCALSRLHCEAVSQTCVYERVSSSKDIADLSLRSPDRTGELDFDEVQTKQNVEICEYTTRERY